MASEIQCAGGDASSSCRTRASTWREMHAGLVLLLLYVIFSLLSHLHGVQVDVFREEAKDGEEAGKCSSASYFVQELIAVHPLVFPKIALHLGLMAGLCVYLDHTIDDAVEALVLVERQTVPSDESSSLKMSSQFMKDLR